MSIKTSGFNAEFGGATGGVISVVTKSGTNSFRGMGGIEFENDSLNGDPRGILNKYRSGSGASFVQINEYLPVKSDTYKNYYPVFGIGGPILRDRAWFFASYSPQIFDEERTTEYFTTDPRTRTKTGEETYNRTRTSDYFQGRVDVQPSNTLRLTGTFTYNPYEEDGIFPHNQISLGNTPPSVNFGGSTGTLVGNNLTTQQGGEQKAHNFSIGGTWTPGSRVVASARVARGYLDELLNSRGIPQETRFRCLGFDPPASAGCALELRQPAVDQQLEVRRQLRALDGGLQRRVPGRQPRGPSRVQGGLPVLARRQRRGHGLRRSRVSAAVLRLSASTTSRAATIRRRRAPSAQVSWSAFGTVGAAANTANSIYFQDRWQPTNRLTINAGVRMENEDLPSFNGFAPPIKFGFGDKIVPRLGVAFDLTGDAKTKLFASYNKFQDRLKFELPRGSFGGDFYRLDFFEIMPNQPAYDFYTMSRVLGSNQDVSSAGSARSPTRRASRAASTTTASRPTTRTRTSTRARSTPT